MTELEIAEAALREFERSVKEGHPWLPGGTFKSNPGLEIYIEEALGTWVRIKKVAEQVNPARRVSLSEDPNWRPSAVAPERKQKDRS